MASQQFPKWRSASSLAIERTGACLAARVDVAGDSASRRRGLLGRDHFDPGSAILIAPCQGVHTFGMRFPIDIVAIARDGSVIKIRAHVPSRRIVMAWSAFAIIELPAGEADRSGLRVGDRLITNRESEVIVPVLAIARS
jgi:uncharacterized protein